jgi:hypothetical protein
LQQAANANAQKQSLAHNVCALLFFEISLCLSRACLGKMMHFMYKWRKKWGFRFPHRVEDREVGAAIDSGATVGAEEPGANNATF